jgi:hypothetical protein
VRRISTAGRSPPPTITASAAPRSSVMPLTEPRTAKEATLVSAETSHQAPSASALPATSDAQTSTSQPHADGRRRDGEDSFGLATALANRVWGGRATSSVLVRATLCPR